MLKFLLPFLFTSYFATAQSTPPQLAVEYEAESRPADLLRNLDRFASDTNRVNALIKASHIYWHQRREKNHVTDSIIICAKQAYDLSIKLHFTKGSNEAAFMLCKAYTYLNTVEPAMALTKLVYGEERARLLLSIAEHYVFDFKSDQKEFSQALPLIIEAKRTSGTSRSERWSDECQILLGKYQFKSGSIKKGKDAYMEIINSAHSKKDYSREAGSWSSLGTRMPEDESTYPDIVHCHEQAVKYFLLAGKKKDAAYSLRDLAVTNSNYNQPDSAEHQMLRAVALLKSINERITMSTYTILAGIYQSNGKYDKALFYAFEALKVPEKVDYKKIGVYIVLAEVYHLLKNYPSSVKYYQLVSDYCVKRNLDSQFIYANSLAITVADGGNPEKAISFLTQFIKAHPLQLYNFKQLTAATYADIYNKIGNYKLAERYYLEMLSYNAAVRTENRKNLDNYYRTTLAGSGAYFKIGKFYTERKNFGKAKNYLSLSLVSQQYLDVQQKIETNQLLFKADSALGNYLSAIGHFEKSKALSDSVNGVAINKRISELNIKYETAQRLKDIKALQNTQLLQEAKLQHADFIRNIILGCAGMLLLLALIAYYGYRNKQKANKEITKQREEIKSQYSTLQDLLAEKENFIKEKDWLLKEIHHRVKNNLQIVMSLLSTQSAYLQNDDAIEAILESENRVQSIALIHQKLYNSQNVASISMPDYTTDLTLQLSQAFDTSSRKIRIRNFIEDIYLDLSQAVPLGLILNEAITNAIKYAFDPGGGEIIITFKRKNPDSAVLTVADNGKGLPTGFNIGTTNSLGMEMMQGLSKQLKGTFHIETSSGTIIQIEFELTPTLLNAMNA